MNIRKIEPPLWTMCYGRADISAYAVLIGPRCCMVDHEPEVTKCSRCGRQLTSTKGTRIEIKVGTDLAIMNFKKVIPEVEAQILAMEWVDLNVKPIAKSDDSPSNNQPPKGSGPQDKTDDDTLVNTILEIGWPGKVATIWHEENERAKKGGRSEGRS